MPGTNGALEVNVCNAFRALFASVVKATTGAQTTIASTADGYTRTTGSFLTDGFSQCDEVVVTGYTGAGVAANGLGIITYVDDLIMQVTRLDGAVQPVVAAGAAVTIRAGMPQLHILEDRQTSVVMDRPWTRELFQPGLVVPASLRSPTTLLRHVGVYWLQVFYPADSGTDGVKRLRGKIMESIYPAMDLRSGGQVIRVQQAAKKPHSQEPEWVGAPIAFHWQADTLNPA